MKKYKFLLFIFASTLIQSLTWASEKVFEKGFAIYRDFNQSGIEYIGHAGIYLNNKSDYNATKEQFDSRNLPDIINSDDQHRVIHAVKSGGVKLDSFNTFRLQGSGLRYWGSYNSPYVMTSLRRLDIVIWAGRQIAKEYVFTSAGWKGPNNFRCDGLVSYVYSQAGVPIQEVESGKWHKNSPAMQSSHLIRANANNPSCGNVTITNLGSEYRFEMTATDNNQG